MVAWHASKISVIDAADLLVLKSYIKSRPGHGNLYMLDASDADTLIGWGALHGASPHLGRPTPTECSRQVA
jgi:hypothetical protein